MYQPPSPWENIFQQHPTRRTSSLDLKYCTLPPTQISPEEPQVWTSSVAYSHPPESHPKNLKFGPQALHIPTHQNPTRRTSSLDLKCCTFPPTRIPHEEPQVWTSSVAHYHHGINENQKEQNIKIKNLQTFGAKNLMFQCISHLVPGKIFFSSIPPEEPQVWTSSVAHSHPPESHPKNLKYCTFPPATIPPEEPQVWTSSVAHSHPSESHTKNFKYGPQVLHFPTHPNPT